MIDPKDEELHSVGEGLHWQESYYFNWGDPDGKYFGLTRIGYRFREKQIDGLLLTWRDGRPEFVYPAINLSLRGDPAMIRATEGLRAKGLTYRMKEPLSLWHLSLAGRRSGLELEWKACTPAFDFREGGGELLSNAAGHHFEQSGRVEGEIRVRGRRHRIRGFGQRDKSWGVRDWARVEGWDWISAQFGEDLSFNAWQGRLDGKIVRNGFVFRDGRNYAIESFEIAYEWGDLEHVPERLRLKIKDASGLTLEVTADALMQCPLVRRGLFLQETPSSFTAHLPGGERNGIGIIEHAWHAGTWGTLGRLPQFLGAARHLLRP